MCRQHSDNIFKFSSLLARMSAFNMFWWKIQICHGDGVRVLRSIYWPRFEVCPQIKDGKRQSIKFFDLTCLVFRVGLSYILNQTRDLSDLVPVHRGQRNKSTWLTILDKFLTWMVEKGYFSVSSSTRSTHPLTMGPLKTRLRQLVPYLCNKTNRPLWLHPTKGSGGLAPWLGTDNMVRLC